MEDIVGLIESITEKVEYIARTETVIGDPVSVTGKKFFPLIKIRIGFGVSGVSGEGEKSGQKSKNMGQGKLQGGGSGGGIKISPIAMVCMDDESVKLLELPKEKKGLSKLIDRFPDFMENIWKRKREADEEEVGQTKTDEEEVGQTE